MDMYKISMTSPEVGGGDVAAVVSPPSVQVTASYDRVCAIVERDHH
jgi:hypothetical protein